MTEENPFLFPQLEQLCFLKWALLNSNQIQLYKTFSTSDLQEDFLFNAGCLGFALVFVVVGFWVFFFLFL